MTEESTVIHSRIPTAQDDFIERMVKTPEFDSKTHVVKFALHELQEKIEGKDAGCYPPRLPYKDREEYNEA